LLNKKTLSVVPTSERVVDWIFACSSEVNAVGIKWLLSDDLISLADQLFDDAAKRAA